jgi:2-polyprenyl-3-methyl-5-hydroxy-6-metoxy-1,4-benzoquinol methylase
LKQEFDHNNKRDGKSLTHEWYLQWFNSPYYFKLYGKRNRKEAREFLDRLFNLLKPQEGAKVLDLACGRGRHSRYLAEKRFIVTGIDTSENSIAHSKQFEN